MDISAAELGKLLGSKTAFAVYGWAGGFFTKFLHGKLDDTKAIGNIEFAVYKETAGNYQNLVGAIETFDSNQNTALHIYVNDIKVSDEWYQKLRTDIHYPQLTSSKAIDSIYLALGRFKGKGEREEDFEYAREVAKYIEQALKDKSLNRKLFTKHLHPRLQKTLKAFFAT
jgi:hypothetical protein